MNPTLESVALDPALLHGAIEVESTSEGLIAHRLPGWARARGLDPQLAMVEAQPSGVRIVLETAADVVELTTRRTRILFAGVPPRPDGRIDLVIDGEVAASHPTSGGTTVTIDPTTGLRTVDDAEDCRLRFELPGGSHRVELWLPHQEQTVVRGLGADAAVAPVPPSGRRWLHHGSSISQGSNAVQPTGTWPAVAARALDLHLTNLGFGGSALMDPFVARAMAAEPADLISLELGINLVNADLMRRRALGPAVHGWLDTLREAHPEVPIVLISPLHCPIHEDTPGPGAFDLAALGRGELAFVATGDPAEVAAGKLTLQVVREVLTEVVAARGDDPQLRLVDGRDLLGPDDLATDPLVDGLHPSPAAQELIGRRYAAIAV